MQFYIIKTVEEQSELYTKLFPILERVAPTIIHKCVLDKSHQKQHDIDLLIKAAENPGNKTILQKTKYRTIDAHSHNADYGTQIKSAYEIIQEYKQSLASAGAKTMDIVETKMLLESITNTLQNNRNQNKQTYTNHKYGHIAAEEPITKIQDERNNMQLVASKFTSNLSAIQCILEVIIPEIAIYLHLNKSDASIGKLISVLQSGRNAKKFDGIFISGLDERLNMGTKVSLRKLAEQYIVLCKLNAKKNKGETIHNIDSTIDQITQNVTRSTYYTADLLEVFQQNSATKDLDTNITTIKNYIKLGEAGMLSQTKFTVAMGNKLDGKHTFESLCRAAHEGAILQNNTGLLQIIRKITTICSKLSENIHLIYSKTHKKNFELRRRVRGCYTSKNVQCIKIDASSIYNKRHTI